MINRIMTARKKEKEKKKSQPLMLGIMKTLLKYGYYFKNHNEHVVARAVWIVG